MASSPSCVNRFGLTRVKHIPSRPTAPTKSHALQSTSDSAWHARRCATLLTRIGYQEIAQKETLHFPNASEQNCAAGRKCSIGMLVWAGRGGAG